MGRVRTIARRTFLFGSVAVAGGLAFGYWKYKQPYGNPLAEGLANGEAALTPYVVVRSDGITIATGRSEMGQGAHTTLAALVAEELDVRLDQVTVEAGPASFAYYNAAVMQEAVPFAATDDGMMARSMRNFMNVPAKFMGFQITGGSSSIPDGYEKMRLAGAAAREVLKQAAAQKLGLAASTLKTEEGAVIAPDGTSVPYTELAALAAGIEPPGNPVLRPKSEWKLLGKSQPRVDVVAKTTGTATYSIDVRLPGMKFATIKRNPRQGGAMNGYDASEAEAMKGVERVIPLSNGVAVVADTTWTAIQAANAIEFDWGPAPYPATTAEIWAEIDGSFTPERQNNRNRDDGDVEAALAGADSVVEGAMRVPYQAHATMEPMNAVALLEDGALTMWVGTQAPTLTRTRAAEAAGVPEEAVTVHTTFLGGGFGRRGEIDFVEDAALVAKAMPGVPVLTTWSREEDMCRDMYRPIAAARYRASVRDGKVAAVDLSVASSSIIDDLVSRRAAPFSLPEGQADVTISQAAWDQPYGIENYRVTGYRAPSMVPIGSWRSVGASQNAFFHETMMDEIARAAALDPVEMRLDLLTDGPSRKVLEAVAEMSDWGGALPDNRARGVAFSLSFGVPTAEVIEVEDTGSGLRVAKVWAAADVGVALDPRNLDGQLMSGVIFGLGAAISGEITVDDGVVEQTNYHDYEPMRMHQAPDIVTRILENQSHTRGIGEPGTPPAAPALGNAIFALTGQRLLEMPFNKFVDFV